MTNLTRGVLLFWLAGLILVAIVIWSG